VTCIVGIVDKGSIFLGGDRGVSDDSSILSMLQPKVSIKDGWIYGYAGSLGNGQLFDFIDLPTIDDTSDIYMVLRMDIVETYKSILDTHGSDKSEDGTDFIIGCRGRLFEFNTEDWGVAEISEVAIGSGGNFALGSLYTSKELESNPHIRVTYAINAAITYSPTCQGPIDIVYI